MIGRARTAMKFLTIGLVAGVLFAPRSGEETRKKIVNTALGPIRRDQHDA